ncbi:MAG: TetR/AcrR family transcriptional regulator [Nocardioides sp.]
MNSSPATRLSGDRRRDLVLEAATRAFARTGFSGTSTDAVAREAGVSQPYVVRIFGTKQELFLASFERATDRIRQTFADVISAGPFDPDGEEDWARLGAAYTELLADHDSLLVMMHGFAAGGTAEIGSAARRQMGEIYEVVRSSGCSEEQARDFIAHGMLLNVMLAMHAPHHLEEDRALGELTRCAFGEALQVVPEPST